jgi:hypothetical protein
MLKRIFALITLLPVNYFNTNCIVPIKSFISNTNEWLKFNKKKEALIKYNNILNLIKTIEDVKLVLKLFKWTKEKVDVIPNEKVLALRLLERDEGKFNDDCDGAATLAKICFEKINIKSKLYYLGTYGEGHMINVTNTLDLNLPSRYITSNENVKLIVEDNWKNKILQQKYNYVKDYDYSFQYRPWLSIVFIIILILIGLFIII